MKDKKYFETVPEPIKYNTSYPKKVCFGCMGKSTSCKTTIELNKVENAFNQGAKKQLDKILEDYVLIPRWKDGKRPE